jgi:hypothetical protein
MVPAASPGPESHMVLRQGDAAGTAFVPRSEALRRLHRPYKEYPPKATGRMRIRRMTDLAGFAPANRG